MEHSLHLMEAHTVRSDKFYEVYIEKDRLVFIKEREGFFEILLDAILNSYPIAIIYWLVELVFMLFCKKQNHSIPTIGRKFNLEKQLSKRDNFERTFNSIQSVSVEESTIIHKGWPYDGKIHFQLKNDDTKTFIIASSTPVKSIVEMFKELQLPCNETVG